MRQITMLSLIIIIQNPLLYSQVSYTTDTSRTYQTIHGFGASDAWSNDILNLMTDSVKSLAADWLFSKEINPDGSFKGIGLSIWRNNLGAGSTEQGDSSYIGDPFRRTESFLNADGSYDWNKQTGVQWMIKAAKARGLENLIMFSNSPPVYLTKNRKAFSGECGITNLPAENHEAFAGYIVKSLEYYEDQGIHFDYISPVNEPEWGWCQSDGQEGCPYTNEQIAELVRHLNLKLTENKLTTGIQIPESGLLVFANSGYRFKPGRQHQVKDFFGQGRTTYLGGEQLLASQLCAHSYFTEWPPVLMRSVRKRIAGTTSKYGIEYWMTEYCILRKTKEIEGGGRDLGMNTALYVSRVIHHDLVYGNASAWCWWLGISAADFKDGLVYTGRDGKGLTDSKSMWAMGNFSQFIHPGAMRIDIKGKYDRELLVSAYRNKGSEEIIIVVINMKPEKQTMEIKGIPHETITSWETSENSDLAKSKVFLPHGILSVSPESVTTFVFEK